MSKLDELIQELCPNGVEYKAVGNVSIISRGRVMSKEYIKENHGEYPVYSSQTEGNGELGCITTFDFDGEYLTWTTDGANAGSIFYRNEKFSVTNVCGLIKANSNIIITRFLFFALSMVAKSYVSSGMGNPKLMSNVLSRVKIPVPPLEVQREIVRILDNFTELTARKKQYEYYRDSLLTFGDDVPICAIGDIANCFPGATPKTSKSEYWENGTIPWMSSGEVNYDEVIFTEKKISQLGYDNTSTKMVPVNSIVIALAGQGKTRGKVAITRIPLCTNQSLCAIVPSEMILSRFLFHFLRSQYQQLRDVSSGDGTRGGLNLKIINSYMIPIPPLEVQCKIIRILDNFFSICNDISAGIPAEIEARQKQYEYYRDKLLDFKELNA